MKDVPTVVAFCGSMIFWILVVVGIVVAGLCWKRTRAFARTLVSQWRPALVIAVLYAASMGLGGRGFLNPSGIGIFCQALVGLALARDITDYESLPVACSVARREHVLRRVGMMLCVSVLLVPVILIVSMIGSSIGRFISGGASLSFDSVAGMFPVQSWRVFFLMLAGAGIAEETPYRLVILSLLWRLTRRRWMAIVLSAVIFGAYHLTPLNSMYTVHWQAPIPQFFVTTLAGLVMGYVYTKCGYETVVLGHTWELGALCLVCHGLTVG
jgi:membrane protease YdiL (CAAX protease family)